MSNLYQLINKRKIKRYLRARRKIDATGVVSHITQRAAGKEPLFIEDPDYFYMIKLLKETSVNFNINFYAFVLMTNHLHLLLQPMDKNLFQAMKVLFMRYAIYFNWKYERRGHLFGSAYRQAVCLNDNYLLAASLYIHVNPVAAGLVNHYSHYQWSSWKIYTEEIGQSTFINPFFILDHLSPNRREARNKYHRKLEQANELKSRVILKDKKAVSDFRELLAEKFPGFFKFRSGQWSKGLTDAQGFASDEEIEEIISSLEEKQRLRKPSDIKARKFLIEQLLARGFTRLEIARKLNINRKTLYKIIKAP